MSELNLLAAELHELWDSEYDEVEISHTPSYYKNPGYWQVTLVGRTEGHNEHHADWAEYRWVFCDSDLELTLTMAIEFAKALRELAPEDE